MILKPRTAVAAMLAAVLALGILGLAGCSAGGTGRGSKTAEERIPDTAAPAFPVTVTDDASRTVTIAAKPVRIVSLAPANTEIVTAVGVPLSEIVGVTTFDDYPVAVKSLPKVGDFMNPNLEAITAARPDIILITGGIQNDVLGKLQGTGAKVLVVDPKTLEGLFRSIGTVGIATGRGTQAEELIGDMKRRIGEVAAKVASVPKTRAFIEIGYNPLFTVGKGTLMDDMLVAAGGANVVAGTGYVPYSVEQLLKDDPTVYFATSGGNGDPGAIAKRAGFDKIAAVKNGRVVILDDNLVSRPGPRVVLGLEAMAKALHPDAFK